MLLAPCYLFALHFKICTSAFQKIRDARLFIFLKLYARQVVLFCTGLTKITIQIGKALTCVSSYVFCSSKNFSHMGWIFLFNIFKYCIPQHITLFYLKYASNFSNSNKSNTFLWEIFCIWFIYFYLFYLNLYLPLV